MLLDLLALAIEERISPGETGIVLSGGLDSSTVACLAPRELPTFTGYYQSPGFDERGYASLVRHPEHHEVLITPEDFVQHFDSMVEAIRPPVMGMGTFGQYMVAKYIHDWTDVRVVLSGEGSDELFGGYARQMMVAGEDPPEGYENYVLPEGYPRSLPDALQYDLDRLPDLLAVDDQMTGAWGLQARAPFTDPKIREYALDLPYTERVGKRHLRRLVRGIVPDVIVERRNKMGFPIPLVQWAQVDPVRSFVLSRIGYLPDPAQPWERGWWLEMVGK